MAETTTQGVWAVALLDGTRAVIGKVHGVKELTAEAKNQILSAKGPLTFERAYDFFSPVQQIPPRTQEEAQMGPRIGRMPVILGFEFAFNPCPVYVRWSMIYFLDEMDAADKKTYLDFLAARDKQEIENRAARAGIVAPAAPRNGSSIITPGR